MKQEDIEKLLLARAKDVKECEEILLEETERLRTGKDNN